MRGFLKFIDQRSASIIALVLTDILFFSAAFFAAYFTRNNLSGSTIQPFGIYTNVFPIVILIMLICFYIIGLYEKQKRISPLHELSSLIKAISLTALLIMAYSFLRKFDYSRAFVMLLWGYSFVAIYIGQAIIYIGSRRHPEMGLLFIIADFIASGTNLNVSDTVFLKFSCLIF